MMQKDIVQGERIERPHHVLENVLGYTFFALPIKTITSRLFLNELLLNEQDLNEL